MKSPLGLFLLLLAGCAASTSTPTTPDTNTETIAEVRQRDQDQATSDQRRRSFQNVLLQLDQAMESHAQALANRGVARADEATARLEKLLQETVLDRRSVRIKPGQTPPPPGDNFARLKAAAIDGSNTDAQGIALAALGFSGDNEVMPTILAGAQLDNPVLVDRAVFGLAMLRAPATPPGVLAAIVDNSKLVEASRTQAAWALHRLQPVSEKRAEIVAIWQRLLGAPQGLPGGVLVQTLRGTGLLRDATHIGLVAPFLRHTVPMVRMAAADALARMNAQDHAADLITLLGPDEPVPNVRLHARKALQELAGHADYGYDVAAWRKAFDRGK